MATGQVIQRMVVLEATFLGNQPLYLRHAREQTLRSCTFECFMFAEHEAVILQKCALCRSSYVHGPVTFNLNPPKTGSPRNKCLWNIRTHSENFVPTIGQPHERKSVTILRTLVEFTVAYLEKWITAFYEYASVAPHSVQNVWSSQTWHIVRGNWEFCAARNKTTVHCTMMNLGAWAVPEISKTS